MKLRDWLLKYANKRPPDYIIGPIDNPYLLRWFILPRNKVFNVYLHCFLRSDDDRALHDHPWMNMSWLLLNGYFEHTVNGSTYIRENTLKFRLSGEYAHRIEIINDKVWTLFITGPRYRMWGFYCPNGWVSYKQFTKTTANQSLSVGCD